MKFNVRAGKKVNQVNIDSHLQTPCVTDNFIISVEINETI